jgi:hypothetical protein
MSRYVCLCAALWITWFGVFLFSFICFFCLYIILLVFLGAGSVKSETAVFKQSYLEQMKNAAWPESKYGCCYGIQ